MNRSTPGLPVHHQLLEFTQTHVHLASDATQPSHPLSSPSPPAPNPSQHQGLFHWGNPSNEVAKVLEFQLQHQSFQWTLISFRMDWLDLLAPLRCTLSYCHNTGKSTVKIKAVSFNLKVGQKVKTVRKQKSVKPASSTLQLPSLKISQPLKGQYYLGTALLNIKTSYQRPLTVIK